VKLVRILLFRIRIAIVSLLRGLTIISEETWEAIELEADSLVRDINADIEYLNERIASGSDHILVLVAHEQDECKLRRLTQRYNRLFIAFECEFETEALADKARKLRKDLNEVWNDYLQWHTV
jgi:hypothetical protein